MSFRRSRARKFADFMRFFDIDYTAPEAPVLTGVATETTVTASVDTAKSEMLTVVENTAAKESIVIASSNKNLQVGEIAYVSTDNVTLTLPATPSEGDKVGVIVIGEILTTVLDRNGQNIMGVAENMTLNKANLGLELVFTNATNGWRIL